MIDLQTGEQTYVSRLRVRGSGLDPLAAQLRLASLFRAAEVQPAGLAPSAIVCIRQLDDPRPRTVSLAANHTGLPHEWQQSVRASIEQLARRGARPARAAVGADEPCVVFADRAELLAALAGDWCEQRAATRWWWRSLFKETIDTSALVKLWQQTPEYVPGALEHLARRHKALAFARALPPDAARAILDALTRRFALGALRVAVSAAPQDVSHVPRAAHSSSSSPEIFAPGLAQGDFQFARPELEAAGDPPWHAVAPEALSDELNSPQQSLLGVGLTLQRAPSVARSRAFALRVNAWTSAHTSGRRMNAAIAAAAPGANAKETARTSAPRFDSALKFGTPQTRTAIQEQRDAGAASPGTPAAGAQNPARLDSPELGGADDHAPAPSSLSREQARAGQDATTEVELRDDGAHASESVDRDARVIESAARVERVVEPQRIEEREADTPPVSPAEHEAAEMTAPPLLEARVETRFGGLFHLVNLGLFLELYGDFTAPGAPGIALSIWDFVALLGRRLCGARVEQDAVWPLLAQLAGRDAKGQPGANFQPPDEWRMDSGWLRTFPASDEWRWAVVRGARRESRLQVMHPEKFLVLDVPLDGEAETQLARELKAYAHEFGATPLRAARPYKLRGRAPLARWVERVHLYARARLRRALGVTDPRRAARLLCERHARVFVTATHVDIVMRLAELPFEVRMSGLDRDPGWIPAAGRIVAFHFE